MVYTTGQNDAMGIQRATAFSLFAMLNGLFHLLEEGANTRHDPGNYI